MVWGPFPTSIEVTMNILNWFKEKSPAFDIKSFEQKWPVGSWYISGGNQIVRLSNVYVKNKIPLITVEYPKHDPIIDGYTIEKEDDLSPAYLNGRTKVVGKDADKLEKSYWKAIEKDLENKSKRAKRDYQNFLDFGSKA